MIKEMVDLELCFVEGNFGGIRFIDGIDILVLFIVLSLNVFLTARMFGENGVIIGCKEVERKDFWLVNIIQTSGNFVFILVVK